MNLACCKPKEFGYAAELWTRSALARHVRKQAVQSGYPALAKAAKATVQRILDAQSLRPHKVTYYLERRDPNFLAKMKVVLLIIALQNEAVISRGSAASRDHGLEWMKSRACRPSGTRQRTCHRWPASREADGRPRRAARRGLGRDRRRRRSGAQKA